MSQNNPTGNQPGTTGTTGTGSTGTGSTGSSSPTPTSPAARASSSTASEGAAATAGSAGNVRGIHTQFPRPAKGETLPEGIDPKTRLFHGIAPDTHERISVTVEGLKAEFGDELGEKKYLAIAGIKGGSVFFNPHSEATSYRPPLGISKLEGDLKDEVDEILAATDADEIDV